MTASTETTRAVVLTVEEAGKLLRISRQSAYQAARAGDLPTIKLGRRLLVPRAALDRMLCIENDESPAGEPGSREDTAGQGRHEPD